MGSGGSWQIDVYPWFSQVGPVRPEWAGEERSGETERPRVTGSGAVGVEKTELQEEMRWGWGHEKHPQSWVDWKEGAWSQPGI